MNYSYHSHVPDSGIQIAVIVSRSKIIKYILSNIQLILITLHQTWDTEMPIFNLEKCTKCTIYKRTLNLMLGRNLLSRLCYQMLHSLKRTFHLCCSPILLTTPPSPIEI